MTPALDALRPDLDVLTRAGGTVSIWAGPIDGPAAYAWHEDAPHYAASTMKVAVMAAAFRAAERDELDLGAKVDIVNRFTSAVPGAPAYAIDAEDDNDVEVTDRIGGRADLGWLVERMIVRSSNLATNLVIEQLGGTAAVNEVWRAAGARWAVTGRGIEDAAAREAGINNVVTAADLAALFSAIARHDIATSDSCDAMLRILLAQEYRDDLPAGLPAGTPVAAKNGWVTGVRHGAAVVLPDDEPPFTLVICTSTDLGEAEGAALVARIAEAAWRDRKAFT